MVSRRILLTRAINVGGTGKLPVAQWRELAESLGARDVSTCIGFLNGAPSQAAIAKAGEVETGDDRWQVIGTELHLGFANGAGRSELNQAALGRALGGVAGTARNLNTVRTLIELAR